MKVRLVYYKPSGKYYSAGEYDSEYELIHDVVSEVRAKRDGGRLPGLVDGGGRAFTIHVQLGEDGLTALIPALSPDPVFRA